MPESNLVQAILETARDLATASSRRLSTSFVLLSIIDAAEGEIKEALDAFDLTAVNMTGCIVENTSTEHPGLLQSARDSFQRIARMSGQEQPDLVHMLLGLLVVPHTKVRDALTSRGIDIVLLQSRLYQLAGIEQPRHRSAGNARVPRQAVSGNAVPAPQARQISQLSLGTRSVLGQCSKDLTWLASQGKLDPVIGREKEITRAFQILGRRKKNNPVFIGDAGVGKTALAEGIARMIVFENDKVPEKMRDKHILALNLSSVIAGTIWRGSFEEKMEKLLREIKDHPEVIIFIDELHTVVGAGSASRSNMDVGNILKPALARGDIVCIGATTLDEYREIEKDEALERRFQPITVDPPSQEQALRIINQLAANYEEYHGVTYDDDALEAAVKLSVQYIPDRNLPDKAIDLIDEAGSRKSMSGETTVTEGDIAQVITSWKGIPILTGKQQKQKLLDLEEQLKAKVIGQDHAIEAVCNRLVALRNPDRPIGSFIFMGPTGVGKSLVAEMLAGSLFGDSSALVQIDMSEYQEKHSVSRLVGAPPGYVGHEEGGQLTEKVRRKPFCVVLLDEIEKAHVDVFDLLLQVLEKGHLTDGQGRKVSFKNTIIIMTSNVVPETSRQLGFASEESSISDDEALAQALMKRGFRREFLNRLDQIIMFHDLDHEALTSIVNLELDKTSRVLRDRHMELAEVTATVKDLLITQGYSRQYGAREMRRTIERLIMTRLGRLILEGNFQEGDKIIVDLKEDTIVFSK